MKTSGSPVGKSCVATLHFLPGGCTNVHARRPLEPAAREHQRRRNVDVRVHGVDAEIRAVGAIAEDLVGDDDGAVVGGDVPLMRIGRVGGERLALAVRESTRRTRSSRTRGARSGPASVRAIRTCSGPAGTSGKRALPPASTDARARGTTRGSGPAPARVLWTPPATQRGRHQAREKRSACPALSDELLLVCRSELRLSVQLGTSPHHVIVLAHRDSPAHPAREHYPACPRPRPHLHLGRHRDRRCASTRAQCALCHGPNGDGVNGVDLRRGRVPPRVSDEDLARVITTGVAAAGMPAFKLAARRARPASSRSSAPASTRAARR